MRKYIRHTDELIEMQDRAIKALQQALLATQLALEALQKDRDERGYQENWFNQGNSFQNPIPIQLPFSVPYTQPSSYPNTASGTIWSVAPPINSKGNASSVGYAVFNYADEMKKKQQLQQFKEDAEYWKLSNNPNFTGNAGSVNTKVN